METYPQDGQRPAVQRDTVIVHYESDAGIPLQDWRVEGEPLADVLVRLAAEVEARKRQRLLPDLCDFVAADAQHPVRVLAAYLARHPHYARRWPSSCLLFCLPTLWHWYRFIDGACARDASIADEADRMKERITLLSRLEIFGGPDLPLN
jgi:hypothetical protein